MKLSALRIQAHYAIAVPSLMDCQLVGVRPFVRGDGHAQNRSLASQWLRDQAVRSLLLLSCFCFVLFFEYFSLFVGLSYTD